MAFDRVRRRAQHFTDFSDDSQAPNKRRRKIRNWSNFKETNKPWAESTPNAEEAAGTPDGWTGQFDFKWQSRRGPLQCYFGRTNTPRLEPLVGCRVASRRRAWVNFLPVGFDRQVDGEVLGGGSSVRWVDLWTDTNLRYHVAGHKLSKVLRLKTPNAPTTFEWTVRMPPGSTLEIANNSGRILDGDGVERMRLPAPWAHDSATTNPTTIDGTNPIGVTLEDGGTRVVNNRTLRVIRLTLDPDDMAGVSSWPVICDPETTISGDASVQDTRIDNRNASTVDQNFEDVSLDVGLGFGGIFRSLYRFDETEIPSGTINSCAFFAYRFSFGGQDTASSGAAYRVKSGNDWVVGDATWNHRKTPEAAWLGGVGSGCGLSGTDHDATTIGTYSYTAFESGVDKLFNEGSGDGSVALSASWVTDIRDAVEPNEGFVLRDDDESTSGKIIALRDTVDASGNGPSFVIDYSAASAVPLIALMRPINL